MNTEQVKSLYREYLLSQSKYERKICDGCGWIYSHPLNYCVKCPGRIISAKLTIVDEIKQRLVQDRLLRDFIAGFSVFYEEKTGQSFPFDRFSYPKDDYYELTNELRLLLGLRTIPINQIRGTDDL